MSKYENCSDLKICEWIMKSPETDCQFLGRTCKVTCGLCKFFLAEVFNFSFPTTFQLQRLLFNVRGHVRDNVSWNVESNVRGNLKDDVTVHVTSNVRGNLTLVVKCNTNN